MQRRITAPCRSATALFTLLHNRLPPPGTTWAALLHVTDAALAPRAALPTALPQVASWNLRSLRDPTTHVAAGKRSCLRTWLQKGSVIMLQETHWLESDKATWEADLQGTKVIHSPAVATDRGGTSGGVAIILPAGSTLVSSRTLVPGYAVAAHVTVQGTSLRILSLYFPPGRQTQIVAGIRDALAQDPFRAVS